MCLPCVTQTDPLEGSSESKRRTSVQSEGKPEDIIQTETIRGRKGGTVIRETRRDGAVNVKRVSKDGKVTIEMDDLYDMAAAVHDATRKAQETRPNSQVSLVWVSDGITPIFFEDRDATEQMLIRNNVIFNSLTVEMRTFFKFLMPIGKPIAGWLGVVFTAAPNTSHRDPVARP